MRRFIQTLLLVAIAVQTASAQSVYSSVDGQAARFDYIVRAGQVHLANLLMLQFISLWAMFTLWFLFRRNR